MSAPTIGWSDFARDRYVPGGRHSYFEGGREALLELVRAHWSARRPGAGRDGLDEVVIVPLPPEGFVCGSVLVEAETSLTARLVRRQEGEVPYVQVTADGPREAARYAGAVLYSAAALEQNDGRRSGDFDWEIVCVLAAPVENEPLDPLTMARNMLEKPGGTYCAYSAEAFAEAVWYWSRRVNFEGDG